jgi:electron transfer flavoprotein alpha subunit
MSVLLLAEHANGTLSPSTGKALAAAKALGGDVHVLVTGSNCKAVADAAAKLDGVSKVLLADAPQLANQLAEEVAEVILANAGSYSAIVAPATATGKNVLPRVAAKLDVMQISDITKVVSARYLRAADLRRQRHRRRCSPRTPSRCITVRPTGVIPAAADWGQLLPVEAVATVPRPPVGIPSFDKA